MKVFNTLNCVVRSHPAKGKAKVATKIAIFLGPVLVATKVLGGRWNNQQGMKEFRRNPQTFTLETDEISMEALLMFKSAA